MLFSLLILMYPIMFSHLYGDIYALLFRVWVWNDVWWIEIRIIITTMVILVWNFYTFNNLKRSLYKKLALVCFSADITRKIIWRKRVKSIERCKNIKYSYMLAMLPLHDYSASGKENHWDLVHCVLECGWDEVGLPSRSGLVGLRPKHAWLYSPSELLGL